MSGYKFAIVDTYEKRKSWMLVKRQNIRRKSLREVNIFFRCI